VIRVFNIPAVTWALTAVLLLSGSYHFLQAIKSHRRTEQINQGLHALMNVIMAAMLWNFAPSTVLAQVTVLAGATLWFVVQAVARPEFKVICAANRDRLKCVYHSLSMAGAALMIVMMLPAATVGSEIAPTSGISMPHAHHSVTAPTQSAATAPMDYAPQLAILLTVFFGAAALLFIVLLLRFRSKRARLQNGAAPQLSAHAEHGLEALSAAAMALMFATMFT
jgi:hypothetical protein